LRNGKILTVDAEFSTADLAVLNRDYVTLPAQAITNLEAVMTIVGRRIVYTAETP